jgi:hypothetical protein
MCEAVRDAVLGWWSEGISQQLAILKTRSCYAMALPGFPKRLSLG